MGIVAMIGLIFGPFVSLLFAAWFYVRWQNEEDEELALHNKKICFRALIAAAILLVVFGILKLIFPVAEHIKNDRLVSRSFKRGKKASQSLPPAGGKEIKSFSLATCA